MMSHVCPKCQCYITPPNPWFSTVPPKMCECSTFINARHKELYERMIEQTRRDWERLHDAFMEQKTFHEEQIKLLQFIKENMPKRRDGSIGPL